MKPNSKVKTYHLSEQTCKQIDLLADESGESATSIVEQAVNYLYRKDVMPEHVIQARLSIIEMKLDKIEQKEEAFFSLSRFILPYFIAALPDMFENKEATAMINTKGRKNYERLESLYKTLMTKNNLSFMHEVFADLRTYLDLNNQTE
ncbi:MAG: hypothetical protein MJ184_07950 [Treponema sp.]|uniref:hypothetical protein n=1 Tax=Treponema sp. TaxID=166 RepID=UPI00298E2BD5|nr:hypothetical protein [Treponema sp.]MCQ2601280.1 hypothetical protein [Treponema sp.]